MHSQQVLDIPQRLVGALVYDGLLEEVANLAGELVGSAYAFLHGEVYR